MVGNNTSQAFGPSWDSQGILGSSLVRLVPLHTRQQTDAKGRGPPGQSLSALGGNLHPLNEMLVIMAPTLVCHPLKIGCAAAPLQVRRVGEIAVFSAGARRR